MFTPGATPPGWLPVTTRMAAGRWRFGRARPGRPAGDDTVRVSPTHRTAPPTPDRRALPAAALVLAGGSSRRWGGTDKTAVLLAGHPVLWHVLAGLPADLPAVVVGPAEHPLAAPQHGRPAAQAELLGAGSAGVRLRPPPRWTREQPPGGGPAAGLAAGCAALPAGIEVVVVLAGDLPFAGPAVARLREALTDSDALGADAVIGVDPDGRDQPLLAAYRAGPLRAALGAGSAAAGRSLRDVLAPLRVLRLPVSAREAFDLDTPPALTVAEALLAAGARRRPESPAT